MRHELKYETSHNFQFAAYFRTVFSFVQLLKLLAVNCFTKLKTEIQYMSFYLMLSVIPLSNQNAYIQQGKQYQYKNTGD